jgi:hypothetical protein
MAAFYHPLNLLVIPGFTDIVFIHHNLSILNMHLVFKLAELIYGPVRLSSVFHFLFKAHL